MNKLATLLLVAGAFSFAGPAEAGLVWTATARMLVTQRPALEGAASVRVRGVHRVTVTNMGMYTELKLWIQSGAIDFNGVTEATCSTKETYFEDVTTVRCATSWQGVCDSGIWEAVTLAKVTVAFFFNRTKIGLAEPVFVNCSCI